MRRNRHLKQLGFAAAASLVICVTESRATTYIYTQSSPATTQWSLGTGWDATPVSDPATVLQFSGTLAAADAVVSSNDITGDFVLNQLNFAYTGPGAGVAPSVTISGNRLQFTGATARIYSNAAGTVKPTLTIENDIDLAADFSVFANIGGTTRLKGAITGNASLSFGAANGQHSYLVLSNTGNDYTGDTRVTNSTTSGRDLNLILGASEVIPNGVGRGNVFLSAGNEAGSPTLELAGFNETINGLSSSVPGRGSGNMLNRVRNNSSTAATLTMGDADASARFVGAITNGSTGALSLTKIGSGTQTLSGSSTHTGTTKVNAGKLVIDFGAISVGSTANSNPVNYFSTVSTLELAGDTTFGIVGRNNGGAISQGGVSISTNSRSFTLPTTVAANLVAGQTISLSNQADTVIIAIEVDPNNAANSIVYANRRLTGGSGVTVSSSATVSTTSQTLKGLNLSGAAASVATIDFGDSDNVTLTLNSAPVQTTDGSVLRLLNFDGGDRLLFTGEPGDFTLAQNEVRFNSDELGYSVIDLDGVYELTPVPEPSVTGLLGLTAVAGLRRRRRAAALARPVSIAASAGSMAG